MTKNKVAMAAVARDKKVGAAAGTKQTARRAATKSGPHVGTLAVLHQNQTNHAQGGQNLHPKIMPAKACIPNSLEKFHPRALRGGGNDVKKIGSFQRGTTNQPAVNVGLGQQLCRVGGIHAAAVQQRHLGSSAVGLHQLRPQSGIPPGPVRA